MKTRRILLGILCGLSLSGCRSGTQNQELLERELRCQADQIYELESALDQCESELEGIRRENQSLRQGGGPPSGKGAAGRSSVPIIDLPSEPAPRRGNAPPAGESAPPNLPTVEPGEEFDPTMSNPGASKFREPSDRRIARIVLNKQLTGGLDVDRAGSEGGIVVVFEPRNARGELVPEAGDISIALVDPERSGPEARIARWDFAANQAFEQFHRPGGQGRGYEFELPWPDTEPTNKKLQLFVRYVTPDGRKLISEMPINIMPLASQGKRWRPLERAIAGRNRSAGETETAQGEPKRRRFPWSTPAAEPDTRSEAPSFAATGPSSGAPAGELPSVELGEASDPTKPTDAKTADSLAERDDDPPVSVARRPTNDRAARRPMWTPYR